MRGCHPSGLWRNWLGSSGRVLFSNTVADQIGTDGIRISGGAVLAAAPAGQRELDQLASETLAVANGRTTSPARPVLLHGAVEQDNPDM